MDLEAVGRVGLSGVRGRAGRRVAGAVARRTDLDEGRVAAVIGGVLLVLTLYQTMKTIRAIVATARGEHRPDVVEAAA
ncbi:MAG TPA: hypothetical protein VGB19_09915 [Actinomycetota bacterium]